MPASRRRSRSCAASRPSIPTTSRSSRAPTPASRRWPTSRASAFPSARRSRAPNSTRARSSPPRASPTRTSPRSNTCPSANRVELMKNRQLDVTLQSAGLGVSALRDLATSVDIIVVPIPADVVKKTNDPAYLPATIPANTYRGQTTDVPAAAVQNYLVTHDGVSNDTRLRHHQGAVDRSRPARRRAFGGQGDRSEERARRHAGAAASRRREILQGSRTSQVTAPVRCPGAATPGAAEAAFDETGVKRELTGLAARSSPASRWRSRPTSSSSRRSARFRACPRARFTSASCCCSRISSTRSRRSRPPPHRVVRRDLIAVLAFALAFYHSVFEAALIQRSGDPSTADLVVGTAVDRAAVRGRAPRARIGVADHLCRVPGLRSVRPVPAVRDRASRLRLRPDRRPALPRHRRHLRHPDAGVGDLHLPVHPVRQLPGARRDDQPLQQHRARFRRPRARRTGEGGGDLVGDDGHDLRFRRGQRADRRPIHDPVDEALRLFAGLRRRGGSHGQHGRADHAAGDGRGRVHHGRNAERAVRDDRQGRGHSGDPVLRDGVLDGASRGRAARASSACQGRVPESVGSDPPEVVSDAAARGARVHAVRRLHADVLGHRRPRADGGADPRCRHRVRLRLDAVPHRVLDHPGLRRPPASSSTASCRSSS